VVAPHSLELPAVNRKTSTIERASIPIESQLDDVSIQELAAKYSTPEVTIFVPYFGEGSNEIELRPAAECPKCGQSALEARFGSPPESIRQVYSVEQLVDESRSLPEDTTITFRMTSPDVLVRCTRHVEDGESVYLWHVERVGRSDVTNVVDQIIELLSRRGSTSTPPSRMRAFSRFEERTSSRE
jgi:hypothetical protein